MDNLVGFFAGGLNTLAGGGSFLTIPLLIFTGLEPTVANATNRLGIWFQSFFGVRKFSKMGYFPKKYSFGVVVPMVIGAVLGAYLATVITDDAFKKYLAVLMVVMTFVTLIKPKSKEQLEDVVFTPKNYAVTFVLYLGIGVYGGFVQAGVGFLIIAGCVMAGLNMVRANAVKMFLNLMAATVSVAIFIYADKVLYMPAIALGVGMSIGAVVAVGFSVKVSDVFLKRMVSVIVLLFAVMLFVFK
jgi:uncharacterized membrane protein YfcA